MILGEPGARRRRGPLLLVGGGVGGGAGGIGRGGARHDLMLRVGVVELVPDLVIATGVLLVEAHDVDHGLGMFLLLLLGDAALLQQALPLLGQAGELAGPVVIADVGDMDGILGGGDLDASGRAEHAVDEAGEAGLLAPPGLGPPGLIGVPVGGGGTVLIVAVDEGVHPVV